MTRLALLALALLARIFGKDAPSDAKEQRATFIEFSAQPTDPDVVNGWRSRLTRALAEDRFVVHAQEIRQTESKETIHELLLRLSDDDDSLIPPGIFLPIAEEIGLGGEIDRWVVREAFALAARCRADGQAARLAVNLSSVFLVCRAGGPRPAAVGSP